MVDEERSRVWRESLGHLSRICLCPRINYLSTFYMNPKPVSKSVGNLHSSRGQHTVLQLPIVFAKGCKFLATAILFG